MTLEDQRPAGSGRRLQSPTIRYTLYVYLMMRKLAAGSDSAYDVLRRLIVRGRLAPGTPIVESETAARLRISRTPLREALQRLRYEGLVVVTHGGERPRLAVSPFSAAAVEELYRTTGALEGLAARAAADSSVAERRSLARTLALLDTEFRSAAAATKKDWDEMFDRHDAFHRALQMPARARTLARCSRRCDRRSTAMSGFSRS